MKKTKLTALLMACMMMVSMLGACGGGEDKKEEKPSEKTEQSADKEAGFDMKKVEGMWCIETLDGEALEDYCEKKGVKAEDADVIMDFSADKAHTENSAMEIDWKVETNDKGFTLVHEDGTKLELTYDAENHRLKYELDGQKYVMAPYDEIYTEVEPVTDETWAELVKAKENCGKVMVTVGDSGLPDSAFPQELMAKYDEVMTHAETTQEDYTEDSAKEAIALLNGFAEGLQKVLKENGKDAPAANEADADSAPITQEEFEDFQERFASMVEAYNAVKELYEMEETKDDQSIADLINEAADIINEMAEIDGNTLTKSDVEQLDEAMMDVLTGLDSIVDQIQPK